MWVCPKECVPENLEMKKKVFSSLDLLVNDGVILASSTSSIIPSILTKDLQHRAQCIVAHPVSRNNNIIIMCNNTDGEMSVRQYIVMVQSLEGVYYGTKFRLAIYYIMLGSSINTQ